MRVLRFMAPIAAALALACGKSNGSEVASQDSLGRDLSLAPVDTSAALNDAPAAAPSTEATPAPAPSPTPARPATRPSPAPPPAPSPAPAPAPAPPPAAAHRSIDAGTSVTLAAIDSFTTQTHKQGETVTARVTQDVKDAQGRTVIPAGATVSLTIVQLVVSENKADSGKVELRATKVSFGGESHDLDGMSTQVGYELKGRGVQVGDAAKVGAGAVAGAVVGRVLSGKKKGAVIGGVIGAAAGTAAAINSADRDVVVAPGSKIVIKLSSEFTS
jgi:Glycine zipper 2TM domain